MSSIDSVNILYFGQLAELLGKTHETVNINTDTTLSALRDILSKRNDHWHNVLNNNALLCAINHTVVHDDIIITGGDEVAFFPQVTGG